MRKSTTLRSGNAPSPGPSRRQRRRILGPLVFAFFALIVAPRAVQAQDAAELFEQEEAGLREQEIIELLQRTVERIQQTIETRAETISLNQEIELARKKIQALEEEKRLEQTRQELANLRNPQEAPAAPVVIPFPVASISRVTMGRTPRATVRINGQPTPKSLRVGNEVPFSAGGQSGVWRVQRIGRDGVSFVHDESGTERFLAR